jgi:hypothetical protein
MSNPTSEYDAFLQQYAARSQKLNKVLAKFQLLKPKRD